MERKSSIDLFGVVALTSFSLMLGFNQVVIKVANGGLSPVFSAGVRSLGAALLVYAWMRLTGFRFKSTRATWASGLTLGALFGLEFICLYLALDVISVARASIIFYSMPVWMAIAAHVVLPGERLTPGRVLGLVLAMAGVVLALADRGGGGNLWGEILALVAAMAWAGLALSLRITRLAELEPSEQLLWQLTVSIPILLVASLFFGDFVRDFQPVHAWAMLFQIVAIASAGYLFWFWLMSVYPASGVASFSFLSPVFAVLSGWLVLKETLSVTIWGALALVALGLWLINRRPQVPQKVAGTTSDGSGGRRKSS